MIYIIHREDPLFNDVINLKKNEAEVIFIEIPYKKLNNIFLKIRTLHMKTNFIFKDKWLNLKNLKKYKISQNDYVIFFDCVMPIYYEVAKKINGKKILWCWNTLEKSNKIHIAKKIFKSICSFDKMDSFNYNINYINQFYWRKKEHNNLQENDLLFIGRDKGRFEKLKFYLKNIDIKKDIYIIKDKNKNYEKDQYIAWLKTEYLSYTEVLEKIYKSKCILEINKENQTGLTIRALECIFFNKKLITNNQEIKTYNFYNKQNIYIIENKLKQEDIELFLNTPTIEVDEYILEEYTFEKWLKNILKTLEK